MSRRPGEPGTENSSATAADYRRYVAVQPLVEHGKLTHVARDGNKAPVGLWIPEVYTEFLVTGDGEIPGYLLSDRMLRLDARLEATPMTKRFNGVSQRRVVVMSVEGPPPVLDVQEAIDELLRVQIARDRADAPGPNGGDHDGVDADETGGGRDGMDGRLRGASPSIAPSHVRSAPQARAAPAAPALRAVSARYSLLSEQIHRCLLAHAPSPAEDRTRQALIAALQSLVRSMWGARLLPFGSSASGLHFAGADVDACILPETAAARFPEHKRALYQLCDRLRRMGMLNCIALTKPRVPIVKFTEPDSGLECDVGVGNALGLHNTAMLRQYVQLDERVKPLALAVKLWARARRINEPPRHTLSSYCYVLLVIRHLQLCEPPVLPCLQALKGRGAHGLPPVPGYDTAFCSSAEAVAESFPQLGTNRASVAELLSSFFERYADYDWEGSVVCPRLTRDLSREEKDWLPGVPGDRHLLCIEDPFDLEHDLGRVCTAETAAVVLAEFVRAADLMAECFAEEVLAAPLESDFFDAVLCAPPSLPARGKRRPNAKQRARRRGGGGDARGGGGGDGAGA